MPSPDLCPACKADSTVKDSRPTETAIRRRRECTACGHRWTTMEIMADEVGGQTIIAGADVARIAADQARVQEAADMLRTALDALDRTSATARAIVRGVTVP